ncbi:MAG: hypothetical protein ABH896_02750 [Candidatus Jacksonbacteria bacterium]
MKKFLISAMAIAAVILLGVGVAQTRAQGPNIDFRTNIIQKLAERFNLDSNKVQEVFDEARSERQQKMQENMENRLNEQLDNAVSAGKVTEEQRQAILAKKAEMQEKYQDLKDLTPEQRQVKMMGFGKLHRDFGLGQGMRGMGIKDLPQ